MLIILSTFNGILYEGNRLAFGVLRSFTMAAVNIPYILVIINVCTYCMSLIFLAPVRPPVAPPGVPVPGMLTCEAVNLCGLN